MHSQFTVLQRIQSISNLSASITLDGSSFAKTLDFILNPQHLLLRKIWSWHWSWTKLLYLT